jgi:hypothetical protein
MDNDSTPGEVKRMVKFAMGHANYQGSMTGETIFGIDLLVGEVASIIGGGKVSLRMVLFTYFKMKDKFSVFAELHQTEEMGPVLAIIPACAEAEWLVHMMNKQAAVFLFYFLRDACVPKKFIMDLLKETCNPTLFAEIPDCDWETDMQTLTIPHKKKQDNALEDLENATWYKNAFDLQQIGTKSSKQAADKKPEALFDLDTNANSFATIHEHHLKPPTYNLANKDNDSEELAPAANTSPATPPHKNPNKETTGKNISLPAMNSPLRNEEVGDKHAVDGR